MKEATRSEAHVWFLRGINVGGVRRLPMAALRDHLIDLGATAVKTYIQSGNVAFLAPGDTASMRERFAGEAPERYGFAVPVVSRTATELSDCAANNPFLSGFGNHAEALAGIDHKHFHLGLFDEPPQALLAAGLERAAFEPDDFAVAGRDVYFHLPAGLSGSNLLKSKGFTKLTTGMTLRNWRTVLATLVLATELAASAGA